MSASSELRAILLSALALPALTACSQTVNSTDAGDDAPSDAAVDVATDTPTDTPDAAADVATDTTPLCSFGSPARDCLTMAQAEDRIRNPPGKIIPRDAGADAAIDVPMTSGGCYVPSAITDTCCNRAVAVDRVGTTCCYTFCAGACCGRPFDVDGAPRTASLDDGGDWCDRATPVSPLDEVTREALAAAWRRDALMEHAAIASFARFTLHLMAHGAPPELVADVQRAALDEVDHARLCFSLATRFDGRSLGPGALDVSGALASTTLAGCVRAAALEGCIGETCAALVAQTRRDAATDPEARAALDRIALDESRHAALAWRFVAWAVAKGDRDAREAAEHAFRAMTSTLAAPTAMPDGVDEAAWRAFGMLTPREERDAMRTAIRDVIAPCARALFTRHATTNVTRAVEA